MTNPTSNFGWQMPTSTDLVTDLPADFETFGQAVDTSLADLKGGTTGQILAKQSNTNMDFQWITNDVGDITAVTAGTGLTGGGTSGAVTVSFDQANFGGGQYAAGKNKIINGDFYINQRGFTSTTTSGVYTFDRWRTECVNGTNTFSAQTLTQSSGLLPLTGLSGSTFLRIVTTGQSASTDFTAISQRIENAATFQGQTVTVSFYAKSASGTPKVSLNLATNQAGVGQVSNPFGSVTISTSWTRYSLTANLAALANAYTPSGSFLETYLITSAGTNNATFASSIGSQNATIDIWGVQVEAGSFATPFQTATGTIQGELAACQRYFARVSGNGLPAGSGAYYTSTEFRAEWSLPQTMRVAPTGTASSVSALIVYYNGASRNSSAITLEAGTNIVSVISTTSAATAGGGGFSRFATGGYLDWSAEL